MREYPDELKEVIKAYMDGEPIEIFFRAGRRVWEPFPKHWGLDTFDHYPNYLFRKVNHDESFVTWGD